MASRGTVNLLPEEWEEALVNCCLRPTAKDNSFPGLFPIPRDNRLTVPQGVME